MVCLDLDLGDGLWDASPRADTGTMCMDDTDCEVAGLIPWEECETMTDSCQRIRSDFGDDFGRDEGDRPFDARRWLFRVRDPSNQDAVVWGWAPLDDVGCTGIFDVAGGTITVDRMRWSVSPAESSILGYECELDNPNAMETEAVDGTCQPMVPQETTGISTGAGATNDDCGGSGEDPASCTILPVGTDLDPVDHNLWAVTFGDAAVNGSAELFTATELYLFQELDTNNNAGTAAGAIAGGHPSVRFHANQWHSKQVAVHEYGHLAAFNIPSAQALHPVGVSDLDYIDGGHYFQTREYHAAAALEGFAHFVVAAAWYDLSDPEVWLVDLPQAGQGGQDDVSYDLVAGDAWSCIDYSGPTTVTCGVGTSNELNWASALLAFWQSPASPSVATVVGMLSAAHFPPWYPSGANNDFVNDFDADMASYLDTTMDGEYDTWTDLVVEWELD